MLASSLIIAITHGMPTPWHRRLLACKLCLEEINAGRQFGSNCMVEPEAIPEPELERAMPEPNPKLLLGHGQLKSSLGLFFKGYFPPKNSRGGGMGVAVTFFLPHSCFQGERLHCHTCKTSGA